MNCPWDTHSMNCDLNSMNIMSQLRRLISKDIFELVVFCNWLNIWLCATLANQPSKTLTFYCFMKMSPIIKEGKPQIFFFCTQNSLPECQGQFSWPLLLRITGDSKLNKLAPLRSGNNIIGHNSISDFISLSF